MPNAKQNRGKAAQQDRGRPANENAPAPTPSMSQQERGKPATPVSRAPVMPQTPSGRGGTVGAYRPPNRRQPENEAAGAPRVITSGSNIPPAGKDLSPSRVAPAPPKQAGGSWANVAGGMWSAFQPTKTECDYFWHCDKGKMSTDEVRFVERTTSQLAKKENCDIVVVRSDIHNTTYIGTKDRLTGVKLTGAAEYHYTVEMRQARSKQWICAHVYTETSIQYDRQGRAVRKTSGLRPADGEIITKNPEIFRNVQPKYPDPSFGANDAYKVKI